MLCLPDLCLELNRLGSSLCPLVTAPCVSAAVTHVTPGVTLQVLTLLLLPLLLLHRQRSYPSSSTGTCTITITTCSCSCSSQLSL
jgi:hypothetical protein